MLAQLRKPALQTCMPHLGKLCVLAVAPQQRGVPPRISYRTGHLPAAPEPGVSLKGGGASKCAYNPLLRRPYLNRLLQFTA